MAVDDNINKSGDDANKNHDDIGFSSDLNLSFGDTLYLYPNDTSGSPIVIIKLTSIENYKMWSIAMTFALRNYNKLGYIDGSCKRDNSNHGLANQWDMCNSVVVTWILNYLSLDLSVVLYMLKQLLKCGVILKKLITKLMVLLCLICIKVITL
ncbi:putative LTR copia-type gag-polypeptide [Tanacetum coccineum]